MFKKDKGICISAIDYSETSQILTFFCKDSGKISTIAKGSRRPKSAFGGPIELFSLGDIVFSDRSTAKLDTLTEFDREPVFLSLRKNLFALNSAFLAAELTNKLTHEHDAAPELFDSFIEFLKNIQTAEDDREILVFLILFQLALLGNTGSAVVRQSCANCKIPYTDQWQQSYFSTLANGLICRDCEVSFADRIAVSAVAAAAFGNLKSMSTVKRKILDELIKILLRHFTELLHSRPKTARFILKT